MLSRKIAVAALVTAAMSIGVSSSFASVLAQRVSHGWKQNHVVKHVKMERKHMRKVVAENKSRLRVKEAKLKNYMQH